jgi:hypothetical protein
MRAGAGINLIMTEFDTCLRPVVEVAYIDAPIRHPFFLKARRLFQAEVNLSRCGPPSLCRPAAAASQFEAREMRRRRRCRSARRR